MTTAPSRAEKIAGRSSEAFLMLYCLMHVQMPSGQAPSVVLALVELSQSQWALLRPALQLQVAGTVGSSASGRNCHLPRSSRNLYYQLPISGTSSVHMSMSIIRKTEIFMISIFALRT